MIIQITNMNKRKLEKSQRDHKFKRRRSSHIINYDDLKKKFFDFLDNPSKKKFADLPARFRNFVIEYIQARAAKIIQKNFREYMVKKNN